MSVYAVPAEVLAPLGWVDIELRYRPYYTHASAAVDHNLLYFDADNRLYYDESAAKFVWRVDGDEVLSSAVTFSALQELTLTLRHHETRGRRLVLAGATTGNGETTGAVLDAIVLPTTAYVLGTSAGAEELSDLLALLPSTTTFPELADSRALSQVDAEVGNRKFRDMLRVLAEGAGRFYDAAIAIKNAFDLNSGAFGQQLDILGSILGLPRSGFEDDRYIVFLNMQIELLKSAAREDGRWTGTTDSHLTVARTFVGPSGDTIYLFNHPPYAFSLTVPDLTLAEVPLLAHFLIVGSWAGVYGVLLVTLADDSLWGSEAVAVADSGLWGSEAVSVAGAATWGTAVPIA